jgi:hypothetical protein
MTNRTEYQPLRARHQEALIRQELKRLGSPDPPACPPTSVAPSAITIEPTSLLVQRLSAPTTARRAASRHTEIQPDQLRSRGVLRRRIEERADV